MVRPLELDPKLETLLAVREDARGEIKARIEQRDRYSLQLLVGLGAIAAAALSQKGLGWLWLLAPVAASYYVTLILYSYRIHKYLAAYYRCARSTAVIGARCAAVS